jgi:NADH dehydrogenase/NADH:ubiquinone oxidoreductase subunit G
MSNKKGNLSGEKINIKINGQEVKTDKGNTIIQAADKIGIHIPRLCYHEKLKPYGACRLCIVGVEKSGRSKIVASCAYQVEEGLAVNTESPEVEKIRKNLVELYLALFPFNDEIKKLAKKYGLKETRFRKENNYCILCGLCVRYCREVKKNNAVGFVGRGINRKVAFIPESFYFKYCEKCMECMSLCPTGVFPSNFGMERIPQISD